MTSHDDSGAAPIFDDKAWEETAKNMLRAEMMRRGISYATLAEMLSSIGVGDNELNVKNKVGRGKFSAVFLLQCFMALGVEWIQVPKSLDEAAGKAGAQHLAKGPRAPGEGGMAR